MTTLGRYEILDKLGSGSMGTVYRARDTILDRELALKTIRTEGQVHPELRERFYREARACARLQHPSIVVVYDLGEIDRVAYIAMELLSGLDFRKLIDQRTEMPVPAKLGAMAQICEALAYAHRNHVVHRDIKPSNLFLIGKTHAKVLDFGIARMPSSQLTMQGAILGTPNYMAPEQILGNAVDARADLFSAALVFFELLVYAHPFQGDNIPRRIVEDDPDPLSAHQRNLPVLLERIFARALAKDPDRRYATGDDFAADLRALNEVLLQNSSPTFSRVQLPSEREVGAPAEMVVPPGADPEEWCLAELMRLIPEFEAAMAGGDRELARQILVRLEAIGSADPRCANAVRLCRGRLAEEDSPATSQAERSGSAAWEDPGTGLKMCEYCGASNRSMAVYCIQCGARLPGAAPPRGGTAPTRTEAAESPAQTDILATVIYGREPETPLATDVSEASPATAAASTSATSAPAPTPPDRPTSVPVEQRPGEWWRQSLNAARRRQWILWLAAGVVGMVLIALIARPSPPIPVLPPAATALVAPQRAFIYQTPSRGAKATAVMKGQRIHVLELPLASDQLWVRVQLVRGNKAIRPGYMRCSDLSGWDGVDLDSKLALNLLFRQTGSDGQTQADLVELQRLVARYPNSGISRAAELEMARLELTSVRSMKADSQAPEAWQGHLESARAHLEAASGDATLASRVAEAQSQIAELTAEVTPPPETDPAAHKEDPTVSRQKRIDKLLSAAEDAWTGRHLDEAEKDADQVLKLQPGNQRAADLLQKIDARRKLDEKFK
jgi:serine/threonine-protein kinase